MPTNLPHPQRAILDALAQDYADIGARSRMGLQITPSETKTSYTVPVVGVIREKRQLVLRAPVNEDGSLIPIMPGQVLTCDSINATTAFHFLASIVRVLFEPVPLLYVEFPTFVERRTMRGVPRALATLRSLIKTPSDVEAVIVDISTGGVRLAVNEEVQLSKGQNILLLARPHVLNRSFQLNLHCLVTGPVTSVDPKHPQVRFYGVNFDDLSDTELLILHAYVQECLALETDTLSQMLLLNSQEIETNN